MVVVGATWLIVYNARLAARASRCGVRPRPCARAGAEDGDGVPAAQSASAPASRSRCSRSSSSRSSSARRRRARSCARSTTSESFGGGFDVRAEAPPASAVARPRGAPMRARRLRRAGGPGRRRASRSCRPRRARSGPARTSRPTRCAASTARSCTHTTYELRRDRATATPPRARSGTRWPDAADLAVVDQLAAPRARQLGLRRRRRTFQLTGFYIEDGTFDPFRSACATRRRAGRARSPSIGVLADTAPLDMAGHLDVAARPLAAAVRRARARRRSTIVRARRRASIRDATAAQLESAFLANGMEAKSTATVAPRRARRLVRRSTGSCSASWASAWSSASPRSA